MDKSNRLPSVSGSVISDAHVRGEQRLMLAVFEQAIFDLRRGRPLARRTAEDWFRSEDRMWTFSFVNICDMFDFEPSVVRRHILESPKSFMPSALERREERRFLLAAIEIDFGESDYFEVPSDLEFEDAVM